MSDVMKPVELKKLLNWIKTEYEAEGSIFGISEVNFYRGEGRRNRLWDEKYSTALGVAAGPHTQCAQNIIAAYLCGARFFELKTVQILDELDIEKPCIEAEHEGYNTEWSTELSVEDAYREYVKAWVILHYLPELTGIKNNTDFIFNMSVGYDLAGIQSPKIDSFIENLKDASREGYFLKCRRELAEFSGAEQEISANMVKSITLSTMHGCPPEEQESICRYLIESKHLHTYVKLNPTLLGYEFVDKTLKGLGFECNLKETSFTNDLQYDDAVKMLNQLSALAEREGLVFGVKLSNTLPVVNSKGVLPGDEMYMSGKALYPLTMNLAAKLAEDFGDRLSFSYCGGAESDTIEEIYKAGLAPITMATNLLKPGGYGRIKQMAEILQPLKAIEGIRISELRKTADKVLNSDGIYTKFSHDLKVFQALPLWDCDLAGCVRGCPINQDIPGYINAVKKGEYKEALQIILQRNPLPHITGFICEQPCMNKCTRIDYEEPVEIREIKKTAVLKAYNEIFPEIKASESRDEKIAVIGAGPAGLAAAYFLRKHGICVDVFEKEEKAGGLVRYVIPEFRLEEELIDRDIAILKKMGVNFHFCSKASVSELKESGYEEVILAIGAGVSRDLNLTGDKASLVTGIKFLSDYKLGRMNDFNGKHIIVTGGGNSAIDGARAALRLDGVEHVSLVYRRTLKEMPADKEELDNAISEGVEIKELLQPVRYNDGFLQCQPMKLGEKGADGRASVSKLNDELIELKADLVISAIGEMVDQDYLSANGINLIDDMRTNIPGVYLIGDAFRGPSSVVQAMADGLRTAQMILKEKGILWIEGEPYSREISYTDLKRMKAEVYHKDAELSGDAETKRCLQCDQYCNKCVEVCPNRANVAIRSDQNVFKHKYQIIHIDKLCNECGNCETFCPYSGAPYKDKFTLFSDHESFKKSSNDGVYFEDKESGYLRYQNDIINLDSELKGEVKEVVRILKENYGYLLEI